MILDVFEYYVHNDLDGILLFLDFEKAFDSIEYNFMFKTLEKFNFGSKFIGMIKTLYNKPTFKLKNNGWMSKPCTMQRGIRQGCPVSALLFILVLEILAVQIKSDNEIKGLSFQKNYATDDSIKMIQHADDCTSMVKDIKSLTKVLKTISEFSRVAGPKLNIEKTECLLTGSLVNEYAEETYIRGVRITKSCIKSLGIYMGHDKSECYEKNWTSKLEKLERILSVWKKRNLTIFGKCTIINTLAISKILYNTNILQNPDVEFFKNVSKLIYNFLWKKRDRIKRNTLIGKIEQGGIEIIDVESKFYAAKASWLERIVNPECTTHRTLNDILQQHNITVFDIIKTNECNPNNSDFFEMIKLPQFYRNVFNAFNSCKIQKSVGSLTRDEFLSQFLWNNKLFQYDSKPLCFYNWLRCGILYVKDIFNETGEMYDITYFSNKLVKKNNIICEYLVKKSC